MVSNRRVRLRPLVQRVALADAVLDDAVADLVAVAHFDHLVGQRVALSTGSRATKLSGATRPHRAYDAASAASAARLTASRQPTKRSGPIARRPAAGDTLEGEADIRGAAGLEGGVHESGSGRSGCFVGDRRRLIQECVAS